MPKTADEIRGELEFSKVPTGADPEKFGKLMITLRNPRLLNIIDTLVQHQHDSNLLDLALAWISQNASVDFSQIPDDGPKNYSTLIHGVREMMKVVMANNKINQIFRLLADKVDTPQLLSALETYLYEEIKKARIEYKSHFMDTLHKLKLSSLNSTMIAPEQSQYAIEISSEQRKLFVPFIISNELQFYIEDMKSFGYAEEGVARMPVRNRKQAVFLSDPTQLSEQVIWLQIPGDADLPDGKLIALVIDTTIDGEWILVFRDCYVSGVELEAGSNVSHTESPVQPVSVLSEPLVDLSRVGEDSGLRRIPSELLRNAVIGKTDDGSVEPDIVISSTSGVSEKPDSSVDTDDEIVLVRSDGSSAKLENVGKPENPDSQMSVVNIVDEDDNYGEITMEVGAPKEK